MITNPSEAQSNGRSVKENSMRLLTVLYSLSGGLPGVPIKKDDLMNECARVGVFTMSDNEFQAYRQEVVADAHVLDAAEIG